MSSSAFALIGDTFQARIGIWKCWVLVGFYTHTMYRNYTLILLSSYFQQINIGNWKVVRYKSVANRQLDSFRTSVGSYDP